MSVATEVLLSNQYNVGSVQARWQLLFTPMSTGPFLDNTSTSSLILMSFPCMITLFVFLGDKIIDIIEEENEEKI